MRYYISACSFFVVLLTYLLPFARTAQTAEKADTLICEQLDSLKAKLNSSAWTERSKCALEIANDTSISASIAVPLLLSTLLDEYTHMHFPEMEHESYFSDSDRLLGIYASALVKKAKSEQDILIAIADTASLELRNWIVVTLAFLCDSSAHNEARDIVEYSQNRTIRSLAVKALEGYKDTTDVEYISKALNDTNKVVFGHDLFYEDGSRIYSTIYPVREAAIRALKEYGYIVSNNPALMSIDSMLSSKDAGLRIWAAQRLSAPNGFDSITAVNRLLEALNAEIKSPLSHSKIFEGMSTITENLKIRYVQSLAALKPISTQMIIPLLDTAKGEYENWLNVSLGFSNYKPAHERIREISQSSPNPNVRATAIRSLENIVDTTDIPFLEKSLNDTSWTCDFINYETGKPINVFYPVRSEAAFILFKLGVDTFRRGWDYEVMDKK